MDILILLKQELMTQNKKTTKVKNNFKQSKRGFTLLELVIAISLFAILILIITQVFTKVIEVQKKTIDEQNLQGDIRNAMAIFEDEVQRVTKHVDANCGCSAGRFYCASVGNDALYVKTKSGKCVVYASDGNRFKVTRDGFSNYLTSDKITVENIKFDVNSRGDSVDFRITFKGFADYDEYITYQTVLTSTFD